MRILIITHAPLSAEFGAGQMAIQLGEALKAQGHDVVLWSPHPLPHAKWWQSLQQMRSKVDAFIEAQESFDVIDSPATLITKRMRKSAVVVARSTQPDILYLFSDLKLPSKLNVKNTVLIPLTFLYTLFHMSLVLAGWRRASYIFCLGALEYEWMKKWLPWWRQKLVLYLNALSESDQAALAEIREQRMEHCRDSLHFLWIGRWVPHKGPDILLDFIKGWSSLRPQDTFTLAGCGVEAQKDCPANLLQTGRVKIVPSFERRELYSLLATHEVGLFTSRVEGWGLVLNEMLESGMYVFATRAGGKIDLQPFFDTLKTFPPDPGFQPQLQNIRIAKHYYDAFNWSRIAMYYAASILTGEQSKDDSLIRIDNQV